MIAASQSFIAITLGLLAASASPTLAQQAQPDPAVRLLSLAARQHITPTRLERHTRAIVAHERPSGSLGENAAIDYIVETLRAEGIRVDVHEFLAYASDPFAAQLEVVGHDFTPRAITASFSASADRLEAALVDLGSLDDLPALETGTGERLVLPVGPSDPNLTGAIAMVDGLPRNVPTTVLAELGAAGVVFVNPEERLNDLIVTSTWGIPSLRNAHRLPDIPVAQITRSAGARLREWLATGPVRVRLTVQVRTGWKPLRLAVARVDPPDANAAPYVLLGGHIDAWYRGGTDEGASNAAMVELARAFERERHRLRRGLVVAWWPGHSNARYAGSTWFADHFFQELRDRGIAYVNIDGVGQMGAKRFAASTTSSLAPLAQRVIQRATGNRIDPGRPGRNSDQSFNGIGLPLFQIHHTRLAEDGGYWWWHTPEDTFDKVDFTVLETDTELYVDALSELLAAPMLPLDLRAELAGLGDLIRQREHESGGRLDLSEATRRQQDLAQLIERIHAKVPPVADEQLDVALVDLLRPLHRVLYSPSDPYHPDPGVSLGMLPGLAPASILREEPRGTDRYQFAETTLIRERNRLIEALEESILRAQKLEVLLGGS